MWDNLPGGEDRQELKGPGHCYLLLLNKQQPYEQIPKQLLVVCTMCEHDEEHGAALVPQGKSQHLLLDGCTGSGTNPPCSAAGYQGDACWLWVGSLNGHVAQEVLASHCWLCHWPQSPGTSFLPSFSPFSWCCVPELLWFLNSGLTYLSVPFN